MLQQSREAEWSWLMMQNWLPPQIYSFLCHHNYQTLPQHPLLPLHYHHHQCCCLQSIIWSWVRTLSSHLVEHQSCIRLQQSTCSSIFHNSQSYRGQALHWDTGCLPSYNRLGSISTRTMKLIPPTIRCHTLFSTPEAHTWLPETHFGSRVTMVTHNSASSSWIHWLLFTYKHTLYLAFPVLPVLHWNSSVHDSSLLSRAVPNARPVWITGVTGAGDASQPWYSW